MTVKEKAKRSFNYAVRQASNCRHDKYQVSCFNCPQYKSCDIQNRLEKAKDKMY